MLHEPARASTTGSGCSWRPGICACCKVQGREMAWRPCHPTASICPGPNRLGSHTCLSCRCRAFAIAHLKPSMSLALAIIPQLKTSGIQQCTYTCTCAYPYMLHALMSAYVCHVRVRIRWHAHVGVLAALSTCLRSRSAYALVPTMPCLGEGTR